MDDAKLDMQRMTSCERTCEQMFVFALSSRGQQGNKTLCLHVVFKTKHGRMEASREACGWDESRGHRSTWRSTRCGGKQAEQNCLTPRTSAETEVSSFQTGKQRGEAEALSPSNVHPPAHVRLRRLLRCPEETSNRPPLCSGAERVERCECSGQPARDARRILQLNKKLQLQHEHNEAVVMVTDREARVPNKMKKIQICCVFFGMFFWDVLKNIQCLCK